MLEDVDAATGQDAAERDALVTDVRTAIATLPPRQARVIVQRYGLRDGRTHTLDAIANELRCSRERVRQLESTALKRLRAADDGRLLHWAG